VFLHSNLLGENSDTILTKSMHNQAEHVLILMNPKAGASDSRLRVERLAEILKVQGFFSEIFTDLQAVTQKAIQLYENDRLHALVGVGGDGTAAELVNRTPEGLPIALLPSGNENLLARHLRLDSAPEKLAETIARGRILHLDAGRAGERIFILMAGCGLDAEVVRLVHERRTGHIRSRNYLKPLWEILRTYDYPELRVYCDETADANNSTAPLILRWLAAFNLPCYGGGLQLAPHADGDDAQLDLCGYRGGSFIRFLMLASAVYLRQHRRMGNWMERKIRRVRIESDAPVAYQLDGDPGGMLPVEIEVLPKRLTLIVP
jgi:diacylglycerol kinase (ATP)